MHVFSNQHNTTNNILKINVQNVIKYLCFHFHICIYVYLHSCLYGKKNEEKTLYTLYGKALSKHDPPTHNHTSTFCWLVWLFLVITRGCYTPDDISSYHHPDNKIQMSVIMLSCANLKMVKLKPDEDEVLLLQVRPWTIPPHLNVSPLKSSFTQSASQSSSVWRDAASFSPSA